MTRIPYLHHHGANPGRRFTNSVAALFQERRIMKGISHDDHYHYLHTSSIKGQQQQQQHHGQQQLEQQQQRRLEDYYAYTPDSSTNIQQQQQHHPWYSHAMLLVLIVLITFTVVYATYELYQSRQIRSIFNKAHCATRPLCDDDGDDMSDVYSMQQSAASQHQGAAAAAEAQGGYSMASSSEWKNTTQMEMVSPPSQPSVDDYEASAVSLSPRNHNEYISMSGGVGGAAV